MSHENDLIAREDLTSPKISELLQLDDAAFRDYFRKSPIKRIGRDRFIRNVLIAAGNTGAITLVGPVENLLDDPSPLVRAMAIWAVQRLVGDDRFNELRQLYEAGEIDADVQREWRGTSPNTELEFRRNA